MDTGREKSSVFGIGRGVNERDWYLVSIEDGKVVRTYGKDRLSRQNLFGTPVEITRANELIFSVQSPDTTHLWKISLAAGSWRPRGVASRVTLSGGREISPSSSIGGALVFAREDQRSNIWAVSLDAKRARVAGEPFALTNDAAANGQPDLARGGDKLVYVTNRSSTRQAWLKDLKTLKELQITNTSGNPALRARLSSDGTLVAYSGGAANDLGVYTLPVTGGTSRKIWPICNAFRALTLKNDHVVCQSALPEGRYSSETSQLASKRRVLVSRRTVFFRPASPRMIVGLAF